MKLFSESYRMAVALVLGTCLLWSCQKGDPGTVSGDPVEVNLRIGANNVIGVRAFSDNDTLSVNRILVIPYIKSNSLPEDSTNYTASPELAVQMNVEDFPVEDFKMLLSPMSTCRLVVLGFNRQNYDFYNKDPLTDDIVINYSGSLADLSVEDRAAAKGTPQSAELFFDVSDPFRPGGATAVSATLTRMVGGLSIMLTYVPDGVEMRLYHTTSFVTSWTMVVGTGGELIQPDYYTMTNDGGGVNSYSRYYFPTGTSPLTMELEAVNLSDSQTINRVAVATSGGNQFDMAANRAINLSGDYRSIILGQELFVVNHSQDGINIDDDNWDGTDDTPETDPGEETPETNPAPKTLKTE